MADFQQKSFELDIFELVRPNQMAIQSLNKTNEWAWPYIFKVNIVFSNLNENKFRYSCLH